MAEMYQINFQKSWNIERLSRLYRTVSYLLERVESDLLSSSDSPARKVCLAVIEDDLREVCYELEQHLYDRELIPEELFARTVCVLEEAIRIEQENTPPSNSPAGK